MISSRSLLQTSIFFPCLPMGSDINFLSVLPKTKAKGLKISDCKYTGRPTSFRFRLTINILVLGLHSSRFRSDLEFVPSKSM